MEWIKVTLYILALTGIYILLIVRENRKKHERNYRVAYIETLRKKLKEKAFDTGRFYAYNNVRDFLRFHSEISLDQLNELSTESGYIKDEKQEFESIYLDNFLDEEIRETAEDHGIRYRLSEKQMKHIHQDIYCYWY